VCKRIGFGFEIVCSRTLLSVMERPPASVCLPAGRLATCRFFGSRKLCCTQTIIVRAAHMPSGKRGADSMDTIVIIGGAALALLGIVILISESLQIEEDSAL
jgi:hypothetical protein